MIRRLEPRWAFGQRLYWHSPAGQPGDRPDGMGCVVGAGGSPWGDEPALLHLPLVVIQSPIRSASLTTRACRLMSCWTESPRLLPLWISPVSVDIESGYALPASRLIDGLLEAGAVALNIEDRVHSAGRRLRSAGEHAELVAALRAAADVLYPVGRHDPETLRRLTTELPLPVNAIAVPDQDDPASFGALGVGRISFGSYLQAALGVRAKEILARLGASKPWSVGAVRHRVSGFGNQLTNELVHRA
jgi:hypothetical protein